MENIAKQEKKKRENQIIGLISALNSGSISDCYSVMKAKVKTAIAMSGKNSGDITDSFIEKITEEEYAALDTKNIWDKKSTDNPRFIPEKWWYNASPNSQLITISTADELIEFARKVNDGDKNARNAHVKIQNNIDLKKKEWEPIGNDVSSAFCGVFDGDGHTISNFIIKGKPTAKGFFGHLKGEVYNLTIDCVIKNGNNNSETVGGIAAYNDGGIVGCCASIVGLICGKGKYGALVGVNAGKVFQCYTAGTIRRIVSPLLFLLPFIPMIALLLVLFNPVFDDSLPVFAPIPINPGIERIPGPVGFNNYDNTVSVKFDRVIAVDLETGNCVLNLSNPGTSSHNMVIQICITDAEAMEIMGSTGRTVADQQRLNENPMYDPENHRVILAESGSVPPGYRIESISLKEHADGATLPPGEYEAIVYFSFYDVDTNARAMVESQFAVELHVQ